MRDEAVRGGLPDPSLFSLSGLEQCRAFFNGLVPKVPLSHLTGIRPTQVNSGSVSVTMATSPHLQTADGSIDCMILIESALWFAVRSGIPAATDIVTAALSLNTMRAAKVESESLVARARVVNTGRTFTLAEVQVEDAAGRSLVQGTGTYVLRPMEPAPPPWSGSCQPVAGPTYLTADPCLRPLGWTPADIRLGEITALEITRAIQSGDLPPIPLYTLLGIRILDAAPGTITLDMRASEWLCAEAHRISPGPLAALAHTCLAAAAQSLCPLDSRVGAVDESITFLGPVAADGRDVLARGQVTHRRGDYIVTSAELGDADGNLVAVGHQTTLVRPVERRSGGHPTSERVLATVLFTDIVGSTRKAAELGDAAWRTLLEQHHAAVRKQLQMHAGHEVKTTGDGFLATFASPGRAVQAARAIRDALGRLGLDIRGGLHTGECDISGADVAGIAVHIASRIQAAARPGEILVSSTVRDLVAGSGIHFVDRGPHQLKDIDGDWALFAVGG